MTRENQVSRRQFIRGTAAVGAGVAAAGLFGNWPVAAGPSETAPVRVVAIEPPKEFTTHNVDVLVIGAGAAGTEAAVAAAGAGASVIIVDKKAFGVCGDSGIKNNNTQISSPFLGLEGDSVDVMLEDAVKVGQYVVDQKMGRTLIQAYNDDKLMLKSENMGNIHQRDAKTGKPVITMSTTKPRVWAGYKLYNHSYEAIKLGVKVMDHCMVTSLLTDDKGAVAGATAISYYTGDFFVIRSKATVLATGGDTQLWGAGTISALHGGGVVGLTGDGHAMAAPLGAQFRDLEFRAIPSSGTIQYPTAIANWCCGYSGPTAEWTDKNGTKLFANVPAAEITGRRINYEVEKMLAEGRGGPHGGFFGPVTYASALYGGFWFRAESAHLRMWEKNGLDLKKVEQHFEATYDYGGFVINDKAEVGAPGLYAAGECAMLSGAGYGVFREFSNCLVTGKWAGENGAKRAKTIEMPGVDLAKIAQEYSRVYGILYAEPANPIRAHKVRRKVQDAAWKGSGNWRSDKKCREALAELDRIRKEDLPKMFVADKSKVCNLEWSEALETVNMITMAEMDTLASLTRTESRGPHLRNEYPDMDNDNWLKNVYIKMVEGKLTATTQPVVVTTVKPPSGKTPLGGGTIPGI